MACLVGGAMLIIGAIMLTHSGTQASWFGIRQAASLFGAGLLWGGGTAFFNGLLILGFAKIIALLASIDAKLG